LTLFVLCLVFVVFANWMTMIINHNLENIWIWHEDGTHCWSDCYPFIWNHMDHPLDNAKWKKNLWNWNLKLEF
jgi:hypothetical protein